MKEENINIECENFYDEIESYLIRGVKHKKLLEDCEIVIKDYDFRKTLKKMSVGFLLISIALGPLLVLELGITASVFNTCAMSALCALFSNLLLVVGGFLAREPYRLLKNNSAAYGLSLAETISLKENLEKGIASDKEYVNSLLEGSCLEDYDSCVNSTIVDAKQALISEVIDCNDIWNSILDDSVINFDIHSGNDVIEHVPVKKIGTR